MGLMVLFHVLSATSRVVALLVAQTMPLLHSLVADIQLTSRAHLRF